MLNMSHLLFRLISKANKKQPKVQTPLQWALLAVTHVVMSLMGLALHLLQ